MLRKEKNGVAWFESTLFQEFPNIAHGSFTRCGGVSKGEFSSLNIAKDIGDIPAFVEENRKRVIEAIKLEEEIFPTFISANEVHKDRIEVIKNNLGNTEFLETDALITDVSQSALMIQHADCQAALFYDPINKVIGAVHAGWRGSVLNLYQKVVHVFTAKYQTNPADLLVAISPSLGPKAAQFINYKTELAEHFCEFEVTPLYFDFWSISRRQLELAGVLPHHIEIASRCTYSDAENFFSYRRDRLTGRCATVIWLRD